LFSAALYANNAATFPPFRKTRPTRNAGRAILFCHSAFFPGQEKISGRKSVAD